MAAIQLDPYQQQHSKYFNYQYIPPRLIERVDASGNVIGGAGGGNTGGGGVGGGSYAVDDGINDVSTSSASCLVWYIVIIIMLLSVFLLIGIVTVRSGMSSS